MWVGLDRLGHLLVDASVAMVVFLSLAVVLMLACHQPARRIVLAQAAILVAILMIPLVAASPLPRLNPVAWVLPDSTGREGRDASARATRRPPSRDGAGPGHGPSGSPRSATWRGVTIGLGWIAIGFWGIRRLVHDSAESAAGDAGDLSRDRATPRETGPRFPASASRHA